MPNELSIKHHIKIEFQFNRIELSIYKGKFQVDKM